MRRRLLAVGLTALALGALGLEPAGAAGRDPADALLRTLTLEEKVGQLLVVGVYGRTPTDVRYADQNLAAGRGGSSFADVIARYHVGGFIYFNANGNIPVPLEPRQVQALSNGLQRIALSQRVPVPLLLATDQEGGLVARVTEPATVFPGAMALGATRSAQLAELAGGVAGDELRALGINMDFAPVVDVNVNPANPVIGIRSFGENPALVSELGAAQVRGYQQAGVAATAKHFPGHGDTAVDSHHALPVITHDRATLERVDLAPFRAAIAAGVDAIMTAHIVVPALDPSGRPATLSGPILTGVLRNELGFSGVIVTDSLGMAGANVLPRDRVAIEALKGGADVLLDPPDVQLAYQAILHAVSAGEISQARVDASVRRVLRLKLRRGLNPFVPSDALARVGSGEHQRAAEGIAERSITLLRNPGGTLPLPPRTRVLVVGPALAAPERLVAYLTTRGLGADVLATGLDPSQAELEAAVARGHDAATVVVLTANATAHPAQQALVRALSAPGRPVVAVAVRSPYDTAGCPDNAGCLATYGTTNVTSRALAKVLTGETNPEGRLPVTIPGRFAYGDGLTFP